MSASLESEIQQRLIQGDRPDQIAEELFQRLESVIINSKSTQKLRLQDLQNFAQFLLTSGQHEKLQKLLTLFAAHKIPYDLSKLTSADALLAQEVLRRGRELAAHDPQQASDLAMSLHMMELNREAIELVRLLPVSRATQQLMQDFALAGGFFLEAIDAVSDFENAYADDPEAVFTANYNRARALWGLGKKNQAIQIMRELVEARPDYRSADWLLTVWVQENQ